MDDSCMSAFWDQLTPMGLFCFKNFYTVSFAMGPPYGSVIAFVVSSSTIASFSLP